MIPIPSRIVSQYPRLAAVSLYFFCVNSFLPRSSNSASSTSSMPAWMAARNERLEEKSKDAANASFEWEQMVLVTWSLLNFNGLTSPDDPKGKPSSSLAGG